jgi:hypothetical protein
MAPAAMAVPVTALGASLDAVMDPSATPAAIMA